jgi:hypothetical protein
VYLRKKSSIKMHKRICWCYLFRLFQELHVVDDPFDGPNPYESVINPSLQASVFSENRLDHPQCENNESGTGISRMNLNLVEPETTYVAGSKSNIILDRTAAVTTDKSTSEVRSLVMETGASQAMSTDKSEPEWGERANPEPKLPRNGHIDIPRHVRGNARRKIRNMVKTGAVYRCRGRSDWLSGVTFGSRGKTGGKFVISKKTLKKATRQKDHQLTQPEDIRAKLERGEAITKWDVISAFQLLRLSKELKE